MTTSGPSASSSGFAGLTLPAEPSLAQLKRATDDYQAICLTVLEVMLQRFERRPDYPFIDTKLDLYLDGAFRCQLVGRAVDVRAE